MKKNNFPLIALAMGAGLALITAMGSQPMDNGLTTLPILMLLLASEFGFILTLAGGITGIMQYRNSGNRKVFIIVSGGCFLLSGAFGYLGLHLWATL